MSKREIIGVYPGDKVNAEDVARDMKNFAAQKELEKAESEGFTYVGSFDKDTPEEEIDALIRKSTEMHEKKFFGEK